MKRLLSILLLAILLVGTLFDASAQRRRVRPNRKGYMFQEWGLDEKGDSIPHIYAIPIYVYSKGIDTRKWRKLVAAVKKVYPIAQIAKEKMMNMEEDLAQLETKREREKYLKQLAKEIEAEYTPVLKKMTRTQGKVLIKLIDRETDYTPYQILKDFRNGFVAGFWQTISKIFGHDLKDDYDKDGEDHMIEQIIIYYEAGLI